MATYVLIPGAGGDAWYWHLLEAELRERGHEVVAVDLPAGDDSPGLLEYVDAVVGAIGDRTDLVVVAQSFGGFTAPLVCERVPVDLLVMLNAMVPSPGESAGEWWANTGYAEARAEQAARDGRNLAADEDLRDTFFHDVPPDVTDEAWVRGEPRQSETPFALAMGPVEVARGVDEVPAGPRRSLLPGGIPTAGRAGTFGHYPRRDGRRAPRCPQPSEGVGRPPGSVPGGHRRRRRCLTGGRARCKIQRRRSL